MTERTEILRKRIYENCTSNIKGKYPCDNCYGCENTEKLIKGWLRDLVEEIQTSKNPFTITTEPNAVKSYLERVIKELEQ